MQNAPRRGLSPSHFALSAASEKRNVGAARSSPAQSILSASFCMELLREGFVAAFHPLDSTSLIAVPSINVLTNLNAPADTIRWHAGARDDVAGKQARPSI